MVRWAHNTEFFSFSLISDGRTDEAYDTESATKKTYGAHRLANRAVSGAVLGNGYINRHIPNTTVPASLTQWLSQSLYSPLVQLLPPPHEGSCFGRHHWCTVPLESAVLRDCWSTSRTYIRIRVRASDRLSKLNTKIIFWKALKWSSAPFGHVLLFLDAFFVETGLFGVFCYDTFIIIRCFYWKLQHLNEFFVSS